MPVMVWPDGAQIDCALGRRRATPLCQNILAHPQVACIDLQGCALVQPANATTPEGSPRLDQGPALQVRHRLQAGFWLQHFDSGNSLAKTGRISWWRKAAPSA
jgi:hypothetical protein